MGFRIPAAPHLPVHHGVRQQGFLPRGRGLRSCGLQRAGGYHRRDRRRQPGFLDARWALQTYAPELLDAASSPDAELTVLAPNNDAFANLLASLDVGLTELDPLLVKSIL